MGFTVKEKIRQYMTETNKWISTRQLRQMFGEAADRRLRDLRAEGLSILKKRGERADGAPGGTFFWKIESPMGQVEMF